MFTGATEAGVEQAYSTFLPSAYQKEIHYGTMQDFQYIISMKKTLSKKGLSINYKTDLLFVHFYCTYIYLHFSLLCSRKSEALKNALIFCSLYRVVKCITVWRVIYCGFNYAFNCTNKITWNINVPISFLFGVTFKKKNLIMKKMHTFFFLLRSKFAKG